MLTARAWTLIRAVLERPCAHLTSPSPLRTYCVAARRKAQVAELVDALVSGTSAARRGGSSPLLGTNGLDAYEQSRDKEAPRTGRLGSRPHIGITPRLYASSHQPNDSVTSSEGGGPREAVPLPIRRKTWDRGLFRHIYKQAGWKPD